MAAFSYVGASQDQLDQADNTSMGTGAGDRRPARRPGADGRGGGRGAAGLGAG
jgi:hypothetical protein